jgi:predicted amidohydrolase
MKVAAIQHDIVWEEPKTTRDHLAPMIADAVSGGARLVVVSEMYATGFSMNPDKIAEPEDGPNETFLREQAAQHSAWLIGSVAQTDADGRARNVAVVAGPAGELERYAKIHPFSYAGEDKSYRAGEELITVMVDGLAVTPLVCYDLRFADTFWAVGERTDLFVVVANWPEPRREHWRALLRARAIENQSYVVGVNRVGSAGRLPHVGDSAIIDPLGRTLTEGGPQELILTAEVDAGIVSEVRKEFPFLPDRRQRWSVRPFDDPRR